MRGKNPNICLFAVFCCLFNYNAGITIFSKIVPATEHSVCILENVFEKREKFRKKCYSAIS